MPESTRGPKTIFRPPGSGNQGKVEFDPWSISVLQDVQGGGTTLVCGAVIGGLFGREKRCSKTLAKGDLTGVNIKCQRCGGIIAPESLMIEDLVIGLARHSWSDRLTSWPQRMRSCLRNAYPIFDDLRELLDWEFPEKDNLPLDPLLLLKYDTRYLRYGNYDLTGLAFDKLLVPILPNWSIDEVIRMAKKVGFTVNGREFLEQDQSWPLKEEKFLALGINWNGDSLFCAVDSYHYIPSILPERQPMGATETIFVLTLLTYWLRKHSVPHGDYFTQPLVVGNRSEDDALTFLYRDGHSIKVRQGRIGDTLKVQGDRLTTILREGIGHSVLSLILTCPIERQLSTVLPDGLESKPVPAHSGVHCSA